MTRYNQLQLFTEPVIIETMDKSELFWVIDRRDGEFQGRILHRPKRGQLDPVWIGEWMPSRPMAYSETARELRRRLGIREDKHVRAKRRTE